MNIDLSLFDFDLWVAEMLRLALWPFGGGEAQNLAMVAIIIAMVLLAIPIFGQFGTEDDSRILDDSGNVL